jgi:hypothetical protein
VITNASGFAVKAFIWRTRSFGVYGLICLVVRPDNYSHSNDYPAAVTPALLCGDSFVAS